MMLKIGDFYTAYGAGYWQLIDLKPKIAIDDYEGERVCWKKGDLLGQWAILKKAFTPKMKPRIDFSYEDTSWLKPVSPEVLAQIREYFENNPSYKEKFENAPLRLEPAVTNCWFDLPLEEEAHFRQKLIGLPEQFTWEEFWAQAAAYKAFRQNPPTAYLLNFLGYPWELDGQGNELYISWELRKLKDG